MASITINHIQIRASKSLDILSDICAICQENILDKCNKCINSQNVQCYSIIGECKHSYHLCCMCNQRWELKKRSTN